MDLDLLWQAAVNVLASIGPVVGTFLGLYLAFRVAQWVVQLVRGGNDQW